MSLIEDPRSGRSPSKSGLIGEVFGFVLMNGVWIIMGVGILVGAVNWVQEQFEPEPPAGVPSVVSVNHYVENCMGPYTDTMSDAEYYAKRDYCRPD